MIKAPDEIKFRLAFYTLQYVSKKNQKPRAKSILNMIDKINKKEFRRMTINGCIVTKKDKEIVISQEQGRISKNKEKKPLSHFAKKDIFNLFI